MVFRHTEHPHGYDPFLQENGSPSGFLLEILDILRIQNNGSAEDIHKIAQTLFLRKKTEERWHISDVYKDKKEALFPVLEKLGVLKEIWPSPELCSSLDYIFIHGGHIEGMRVRLNFLNILWPQISKALQDKVHVVFLSGDRKLDPVEETVDVLLDPQSSSIPFRKEWSIPYPLPTTESGAALLVWDQIILDP
ncbi:MAG: hypothetical protein EB051_05465, partial [Chlamydiia bacterium]|nr:hypothetical protein [Chlamydiia bacterium]